MKAYGHFLFLMAAMGLFSVQAGAQSAPQPNEPKMYEPTFRCWDITSETMDNLVFPAIASGANTVSDFEELGGSDGAIFNLQCNPPSCPRPLSATIIWNNDGSGVGCGVQ